MTQYKSRKQRVTFTVEHSVQYPLEGETLDYAKLMVHENYTNKKIMIISGACSSAVSRWRKQYLAELGGQTPESGKALTSEQQTIQLLEKQLWRAQRDNEILKKATALFAVDNHQVI
ncbi:IS3/IS911 family transposase orfA [Isorropodon fossajaponicum endosymbiont JTNG4]|nr:IS3/IS911 family transposase orfA [Isorropodon fossajaponicum endosymbiont JTNG4]BBB24488.1 IS3/IS911 family transposase orfA [Isorropodon fossajaponicum endosymbiont JTNG4]